AGRWARVAAEGGGARGRRCRTRDGVYRAGLGGGSFTTLSRWGIRPGGRLGHTGARLGPGAGGCLHWWGSALASWLPTRWRRVLGFDRGRLLLQVDGEEVQLRLQRGDGIEDLGRVPLLPAVEDSVSTLDPLAGLLAPPVAELPRWL